MKGRTGTREGRDGRMKPDVSIVVPSHNRLDILPEVVAAIESQQGAPDFELVIVDDGSTDGSADWLRGREFSVPVTLRFQANLGPAAARNVGVGQARGDLVALLGDDTVPRPGWLATHAAAHREHREANLAIVGRIDWHPRMRVTPFLEHINEFGAQFGFALIADPHDVPFNFFYSSNISLPRERLLQEPFDTAFEHPAWEDIELGYRLTRRGLRLIYRREARVWHHHPTDIERFGSRQRRAGYSAVRFGERWPALGDWLGLKPQGPPARSVLRWHEPAARALNRLPLRIPRLWDAVLRRYYIDGLNDGWRAARDADASG